MTNFMYTQMIATNASLLYLSRQDQLCQYETSVKIIRVAIKNKNDWPHLTEAGERLFDFQLNLARVDCILGSYVKQINSAVSDNPDSQNVLQLITTCSGTHETSLPTRCAPWEQAGLR